MAAACRGASRQRPDYQDAYRVIQESLTNALRYAQAPTRVRLAYVDDGLDVLVENEPPGRAAPRDARDQAAAGDTAAALGTSTVTAEPATMATARVSGGRGLAGLAERAKILGGSLHAGISLDGGFAVHAWLPVHQ